VVSGTKAKENGCGSAGSGVEFEVVADENGLGRLVCEGSSDLLIETTEFGNDPDSASVFGPDTSAILPRPGFGLEVR
jgi:hypothetical protein